MMPNPELLGGGSYKCQTKINAQIKEKAKQVEKIAKYQLNISNTQNISGIAAK